MSHNDIRQYKKGILKTLIAMSIPTIIEQILSTLLQYVDTAMVGHLGEQATASVSVTTTISWLVGSIMGAASVPILALIAKSIGAKEQEHVREISKQVLLLVLTFGVILGGLSVLLSPYIPVWMGAEEAVQKPAATYFMIISLPMVFRASSTLFGAAIRATQDTKTPMIISTVSNVLNAGLNYLLIYTAGLGVTGAAIASAISYTLAGIWMFVAFRRKQELHYKFRDFHVDKKILLEMFRQGAPVLATNIVSCLGYVFFAGMVSSMGTTIFTAHSIAVTAETIFYIPGYGLRTATSAMIGLSYGERDKDKFKQITKLSVTLTILMMIVSGVVLYFVAYPLMRVFTTSDAAARLGADMLRIVAFSEPFFGLMVVAEGIYYGLGKTQYTFWVESFSMWGIRILFTFLCVKIWGFGLTEVWYCMIADNVMKAVLLSVPIFTKRVSRWFDK